MKQSAQSTDTPKEAEASLVITGGTPSQYRGKDLLMGVGVLLVLVVLIGVAWWFTSKNDSYLAIDHLKSQNPHVVQAQEHAEQTPPKDPKELAVYYADIGANLQAAREYVYAERYYLTAQKVVDRKKLNKKELRYYIGLADVYRAMGNEQKAKEYDAREQQFLEQNYSKETLDEMRRAEPDAPHPND